jgi:hypothetical protein
MSTSNIRLPDWWQRETQRRQAHLLILLGLLLGLIVFFYYIARSGRTGIINGIDFDTSNTIAFVRQDAGGHISLYDVRADGTNLKPLTPSDDTSDKSAPAWNLKGDQLFYISNRDDRKKMQVYIRGANETSQLTYGTGRKESPSMTPDGKRVAFLTVGAVKTILSNGNDPDQILPPPRAEGNSGAEGTQIEPEVNGPFLSYAFSSDGTSIAGVKELSADNGFGLNPRLSGLTGGDQVVEVVLPGETKPLLLDTAGAVSIAWEPNGSRLMVAYAEEPHLIDATDKLALFSGITLYSFENPKDPKANPLIVNAGLGITPRNIAWSPDGKNIAFEAWYLKGEKERELKGIVIMKIPEQQMRFRSQDAPRFQASLPASPEGQPRAPRWSPDGSRLLFQVTRRDNKNDLWVINSDQTNPINLTKGQGDNTQGVWSPARPK